MTARALLVALVLPLAAHAQAPNRLWIGRVELVGPLAGVELDCGGAGVTRITGALVAGERREVAVPLPWAPPLGLDGLLREAPPVLRVEPAAGGGSARWLGPAAEQPEARWLRLPVGLRTRTRPPAASTRPAAPAAALLAVLAAYAAALGLRRRRAAGRLAGGAVLVGGALAAGWLAVRSPGPAGGPGAETVLLDADLSDAGGPGYAVRATVAAGALALDPDRPLLRVETAPAGAVLRYTVDLAAGAWEARAAGVVMTFAPAPVPGVAAGEAVLAPAWWRDPAGAWTRHAAVRGGTGSPAAGADPPGWLRAGLPPGRSVLLGAASDGGWVRVVGAARPAPPAERD